MTAKELAEVRSEKFDRIGVKCGDTWGPDQLAGILGTKKGFPVMLLAGCSKLSKDQVTKLRQFVISIDSAWGMNFDLSSFEEMPERKTRKIIKVREVEPAKKKRTWQPRKASVSEDLDPLAISVASKANGSTTFTFGPEISWSSGPGPNKKSRTITYWKRDE